MNGQVNSGPAVVLVDPQLGENIGACARAMMNCAMSDLRLVRPRDGWPNEKAYATASGADRVLDAARLYGRTEDAIADLQVVYATTARLRDMVKRVVTPVEAAREARAHEAEGARVGILFGPERTGLINDDLALADAVLRVPLNPEFMSLNLAQAVLLVGYEWFRAADATPPSLLTTGASRRATKAELDGFFDRLVAELDETGFFTTAEKRPGMLRNLRNIFQRADLTEQEIRTLHGVVAAFVGRKKKRETGEDR